MGSADPHRVDQAHQRTEVPGLPHLHLHHHKTINKWHPQKPYFSTKIQLCGLNFCVVCRWCIAHGVALWHDYMRDDKEILKRKFVDRRATRKVVSMHLLGSWLIHMTILWSSRNWVLDSCGLSFSLMVLVGMQRFHPFYKEIWNGFWKCSPTLVNLQEMKSWFLVWSKKSFFVFKIRKVFL